MTQFFQWTYDASSDKQVLHIKLKYIYRFRAAAILYDFIQNKL